MAHRLTLLHTVGVGSAFVALGMSNSIWGILAVLFSNDEAGFAGQLVGILSIFAWAFFMSLIVWLGLKASVGIRVGEEEEYEGVDIGECGLEAYPEFTKVAE